VISRIIPRPAIDPVIPDETNAGKSAGLRVQSAIWITIHTLLVITRHPGSHDWFSDPRRAAGGRSLPCMYLLNKIVKEPTLNMAYTVIIRSSASCGDLGGIRAVHVIGCSQLGAQRSVLVQPIWLRCVVQRESPREFYTQNAGLASFTICSSCKMSDLGPDVEFKVI
jgi:hypothetical protein